MEDLKEEHGRMSGTCLEQRILCRQTTDRTFKHKQEDQAIQSNTLKTGHLPTGLFQGQLQGTCML